jgi:hypothetical protein
MINSEGIGGNVFRQASAEKGQRIRCAIQNQRANQT